MVLSFVSFVSSASRLLAKKIEKKQDGNGSKME